MTCMSKISSAIKFCFISSLIILSWTILIICFEFFKKYHKYKHLEEKNLQDSLQTLKTFENIKKHIQKWIWHHFSLLQWKVISDLKQTHFFKFSILAENIFPSLKGTDDQGAIPSPVTSPNGLAINPPCSGFRKIKKESEPPKIKGIYKNR